MRWFLDLPQAWRIGIALSVVGAISMLVVAPLFGATIF